MKFNIGDTVYFACTGNQQTTIPCPICFGKLKVTLILGNGDSVELPCDYCGKGYEGPRGYVSEYQYVAKGEPFLITGMRIESNGGGERREYHSGSDTCYQNLEESRCFATREEAESAAVAIKEQEEAEQQKRAEYLKYDAKKSFSWNAGYHLRNAKNNQKQAEYHNKMAVLCKARAGEAT